MRSCFWRLWGGEIFLYMKSILLILTVIGLFSYQNTNPTIHKFERALPKEDLAILEEMVGVYDEFIQENYEGQAKRFLQDIIDEKAIILHLNKEKVRELMEVFKATTIEFKSELLQYDTVFASNYYDIGGETFYTEDSIVMTISQTQDTNWHNVVVYGEQTIEKKIKEVKEYGYWNHISESSFVNALAAVQSEDKDIEEYVNRRKNVGVVHPKIMVSGTLKFDMDVEDYFIKRIIVFEIFRRELEKEEEINN